MAVLTEERALPTVVEFVPAADPAPLGLAAFALTTFILSGHNASFIPDIAWLTHAGGWAGVVTAAVAWYTSAAGVINGMSVRPVLPVGQPLWDRLPVFSRLGSPMPRRTEA